MNTLRQVVEESCLEDYDLEAALWEDFSARAREKLRTLLEASLETELSLRLSYHPYQRDPAIHTNYRNGHYQRDLDTRFGSLHGLKVPRAREGGTQYKVLEHYARRAPWVNELVREMFIAGVSTRRVSLIMENLLEASVSASTVSRISAKLEDKYEYLVLDGVSFKVKTAHGAAKRLALCVYGITPEGLREMLDYRFAKSESEAEWVALLEDLRRRGLHGSKVALAVTDGGQGLNNALQFVFPRVPLQRCWVHKLRNVANCVRKRDEKEVMVGARAIYQADTRRAALVAFRRWRNRWQASYPKAVAGLEKDLEALLQCFNYPAKLRPKIRTTNAIERAFREVRRRTRPMSAFTNDQSCERIVYALIQHLNTQWSRRPLK